MSDYKDSTICKHCDNSSVDDLRGVEDSLDSISCSNSSCNHLVELANLENTIARLEIKRCDLKRNINHTHSPFIQITPPEIIARISEFVNTDYTIIGNLPAVILLLSVCSDWRRAVVGTPQLWSSIKIILPSSDMASSMFLRRATSIDEWLARSGHLPLNITLYSEHEIPWDLNPLTLEEYRPIFKILDYYSSRWHSLNISIPIILLPFLQPECLPLLEQLHITYMSHWHPDHVFTFPPTPFLNAVEIQPLKNSDLILSPKIGIKWDTVTHMSLKSITSRNCFALLHMNPQLVHCTFHSVVDDTDNHLLESPIVSSLTYLSLHHRCDAYRVLDNIMLPCLETLVLLNVSIDPVIAFFERSACSLQTLSLLDWKI